MNRNQLVLIVCLGALIVSPTLVLVAMQMPLWLPPKQAVLNSIPYADFDAAWDDLNPASWSLEPDMRGI
jgi:hypothetical protein